MEFFGRRKILVDESDINDTNIIPILQRTLAVHHTNRAQIEYLYDYYKGKQPILKRSKEVRPEITNRVVENRANEIVSFKVGYLMGEPIQYVSLTDDETVSNQISILNDYARDEDKASKDKELAEWMHICGTGYRAIFPDDKRIDEDETPFELYTMDPRYAYVAYHNGLGERPVMSVQYVSTDDGVIYSVYTRNRYYEIKDATEILHAEDQILGIPLIEYPLNHARLGAFEVVLPLLDAINNVDSNRMDGIEQFVQALMLFHNVDIDEQAFRALRQEGAIKYKDIDPNFRAEIEYLTAELNQSQTQTLVDHLYQTVLTITGMPNRNGGSSTSDTGLAVSLRDGWSGAEARAKDTELMFKRSEREFLRIALRICNDIGNLSLQLPHIEIRFTRRNYDNISTKADVLVKMLSNPQIHPSLAFTHCGLFTDPNIAYNMSRAYYQQSVQEERTDDTGTGTQP